MKKRYLRKQKLMGLGLLLFAALTAVLLKGDCTIALFAAPMALIMIFGKRVVLAEYYVELEKRKQRNKGTY